jgi:hypothetical protein
MSRASPPRGRHYCAVRETLREYFPRDDTNPSNWCKYSTIANVGLHLVQFGEEPVGPTRQ